MKSVLITGCSTGIGRCAAEGLRTRGYRVFATARQASDVAVLAQAGFEALRLDLDDSASIQAAMAEILDRCDGALYALFNNGGYGQPGAVEDLSRDALRRQLETNLLGWHELTCLVIPGMRRRGEGRIVQNSSVLGFVAMPYRGAYVCAKHALEGLTDALRLELRGSGIQLSLIEPGPIDTAFRRNALKKFVEHIDWEHSPHQAQYRALLGRLETEGPALPFTLPPDAVVRCLIHALESPRPRLRYRVTLPSRLLAVVRRLLPDRALDALLKKISGGGAR
jgi:NAD(P)-dependent dehydrogenase (short-subunit alcohol dehydrogenase family)